MLMHNAPTEHRKAAKGKVKYSAAYSTGRELVKMCADEENFFAGIDN